MPRATFAGVTFDFLLSGLDDRHEGLATVREIPGGPGHHYVDLGGRLLPRRTVQIKLDNEADYLTLAALPGTTGAAGPSPARRRGRRGTPSCSASPGPPGTAPPGSSAGRSGSTPAPTATVLATGGEPARGEAVG